LKARTATIILTVAMGASLFCLLVYVANGDPDCFCCGEGVPGFSKTYGAYDAQHVPLVPLFLFILALAVAFAIAAASHSRSLMLSAMQPVRRKQ